MFVDAHPDDMQGAAGGYLARLKDSLEFVGLETTLTDGTVGHFRAEYLKHPERLREIRQREAAEGARLLGFEHRLLTDRHGNYFNDANLEVNRITKGTVWAAVREFKPDLLLTLPVNEVADHYGMHNDHTNVGEIVKRIAYLIPAPYAFPEYYDPEEVNRMDEGAEPDHINPPVIVTVHDGYSGQIQPDLVIDIEAYSDTKAEAWGKHESQWREWLPWIGRYPPPADFAELKTRMGGRRRRLARGLGLKDGLYEAYTITDWGATPTLEQIKTWFPGDVCDYELAAKKIRAFTGEA